MPSGSFPRRIGRASLFIAAVVLAGCAGSTADRPPKPMDVDIAPGVHLSLPGAFRPIAPLDAVQQVIARYGPDGRTIAFDVRIRIGPDGLLMAALDPMGRRALTLRWTEAGVRSDRASWLPEVVRIPQLLADMYLILWPEDDVRASFASPGLRLVATERRRALFLDARRVVRIDYDATHPSFRETRFRNDARQYTLTIRTRKVDP